MPPKKLSGSQFRKIREEKLLELKKNSSNITCYFKKETIVPSSSDSSNYTHVIEGSSSTPLSSETEKINPSRPSTSKGSNNDKDIFPKDLAVTYTCPEPFDFNDPTTWHVTKNNIKIFVERGPELGDDLDSYPISDDGRHFDKKWFVKILPNGNRLERSWLIYCKKLDALFCFPCLLFSGKQDIWTKGFRDWQHLNPSLPRHEVSLGHRENYIKLRSFERNMKIGGLMDDELEKIIMNEKQKWRHILRVILDAILHCVKNNDALRGTSEKIGHPKCGRFLSTIELISHYDPIIKTHIESIEAHNKKQVSYFSHMVQDELIHLVSTKIRKHIIPNINKATYFSILFDCTPDVSHQEQMTQICRYVEIDPNNKCNVEETFLDFIMTNEHTGEGLAKVIEEKLKADGLYIENIRGQSYDNAANMAGKYKGVKTRILEKNKYARFIPCSAHSLNLIGVHAAQVSSRMKNFFGTVQQIFNFFVSSTMRWDALKKKLKTSIKGSSDTRWSTKYNSIHTLKTQFEDVIDILEEMSNGSSWNRDTSEGARVLLKPTKKFIFIVFLSFWDDVLQKINRINLALQDHQLNVADGAKMIKGLSNEIRNYRHNFFEPLLESSKSLAEKINIPPGFQEERRRKIKKMPGEEADDEAFNFDQKSILKKELFQVLDSISLQLEERFGALSEVAEDFSFLNGICLKDFPLEELKKKAADLALKYSSDLDPYEFVNELESFKFQASSIFDNLKNMNALDLLRKIRELSLQMIYPNIDTALRIFLTLPVTTATCERSFSKLKLVKTYLRSSIGQERLANLAIISIERNRFDSNSEFYNEIIDMFAETKARKVQL